MKKLIIAFSLITAFTASAYATLAMECKGEGRNSNVTVRILDLSPAEISEGEKFPVAVRVTELVENEHGNLRDKTLFAGVVEGETEDVQLFLNSTEGPKLSGTIYFDESTFTLKVGRRNITFSCDEENAEH